MSEAIFLNKNNERFLSITLIARKNYAPYLVPIKNRRKVGQRSPVEVTWEARRIGTYNYHFAKFNNPNTFTVLMRRNKTHFGMGLSL
jgi:hypothetical protein